MSEYSQFLLSVGWSVDWLVGWLDGPGQKYFLISYVKRLCFFTFIFLHLEYFYDVVVDVPLAASKYRLWR